MNQPTKNRCNSTYRLRYWNYIGAPVVIADKRFKNEKDRVNVPTACGMRRRVLAEKGSDDEVRTSLVPDWRENEKAGVNVLTACGIETSWLHLQSLLVLNRCNSTYRLRYWNAFAYIFLSISKPYALQQCLPLTVLKRYKFISLMFTKNIVTTVPTAYGIKTSSF